MRILSIFAAVAVLIGNLGAIERRQEKERAAELQATRVDMGITLVVVRKDPRHGELLMGPDLPRMTRVETIHLGGMAEIDEDGARLVGRSLNPVVWHASERQAELIVHQDGRPLWQLIEGSEGSNKTTTLVRWVAVRVLERLGEFRDIWITGPTGKRLSHVKAEIKKWWSPSWYTFRERDQVYDFHVGPSVQLMSAVQRSEEGGSPFQGGSPVACASDELQDHFAREADIEARGRAAGPRGYKRIGSSTPKDSPAWRDFRALVQRSMDEGGQWGLYKMLGMDSPFIFDSYWEGLRSSSTMTEREFRRRVLAEDVGPERAVYFNWRRNFPNGKEANLRHLPPGAEDVTAEELRRLNLGRNVQVLAGHDPGTRQHVTEFLKAFVLPNQRDRVPRWFVVGEVTSPESTIHGHIQDVKEYARKRWNCIPVADRFGEIDPSAPTMLVRIDPHTASGEEHPGEDVYRAWRAGGILAKPAAYAPRKSVKEPLKATPLKKRQRVDLLNTLLSATAAVGEVRRFFIAINDDGKPAAPMLLKAFETMERDELGRIEHERKDEDDLSHWPAAAAFALWLIESRRFKWEPEEDAA